MIYRTVSDEGSNMHFEEIASNILNAYNGVYQIAPFSSGGSQISVTAAYEVSRRLTDLRGWQVIGRKIGFTNKSIWPLYGVNQPMWGPVSSSSLEICKGVEATVHVSEYCEPRIEPEIVLGFGEAPALDASLDEIVSCIDWVAPGLEVVHSIYPGWKFEIPDTIAAGGLHGKLIVGPKCTPSDNLIAALESQAVTLSKNTVEVETGTGRNVLGGPVSAVQYLLQGIKDISGEEPLNSGALVTTGTLTDAKPLISGDTWEAHYHGLINGSLRLKVI